MKIVLNGENLETRAQTVAQLLESLQIAPIGVAVALNGNVVRRAMHGESMLAQGDKIEIIRAVQGG